MNKYKSLSDSSTNESDDNTELGLKNLQYSKRRRLSSSDDNEEPEDEYSSPAKKKKCDFGSPPKCTIVRNLKGSETWGKSSNMPTVEFSSGNSNGCIQIEDSSNKEESDDDNEAKCFSPNKMANISFTGPPQPSSTSNSLYNEISAKIMAKMGYKEGSGLGKHSQGRVNIIEASQQRGRRGLGLHLEGLEPSDAQWDGEKEKIIIEEKVSWIPECDEEPLTLYELKTWMKDDEKLSSIDDETEFCDPTVLKNVLTYKSVFDQLEGEEMRKARTRSNPYETIRGAIFLNRAAMKMANLDFVLDFMLTNPKNKYGGSVVGPKELLYFADICAGPGGFSEYVLWRKNWECKGFGFTLKGGNDFKLEDFFSGPPETFEPFYGKNEDGDVYAPENLLSFQKFILENTKGAGVHFVMADGGFSVEGQENIQEVLSNRLYLCQFLCALLILRTGGHFVCKLFDIYTTYSVGLVYLMYHAFENVSIFKPVTSRPANSERYIICKGKRENSKDISDYMFEVNCHLDKTWGTSEEVYVSEVVPLHLLKRDPFYSYIYQSNNEIGEKQVIYLDKIRVFAKNNELHEDRQSDIRKNCLTLWRIPDKARSAPARPDPGAKFTELMQGDSAKYLKSNPVGLNEKPLEEFEAILDYHCVVCNEMKPDQSPSFFIGLGRSNIFRHDVKGNKWTKVEAKLELPASTVFYGELVLELKGEGRSQRKITCLHIIDIIFIGGKDMRKKHFEDRMQYAKKLTEAVSKPSKSDYTQLRVKEVWPLQHLRDILCRLSMKSIKNCPYPRLCYDLEDERHIIPSGLLIFKTVEAPWVTAFSKTYKKKYFFNIKNQKSVYENIPEAVAAFKNFFCDRVFWSWEKGVKLIPEQRVPQPSDSAIHGETMLHLVEKHVFKITGIRA